MEIIQFSILIDAPKSHVWKMMLAQDSYREWTSAFHPTSRYEGSWEEDAEIRFLGDGEDGKIGGMYSKIRVNRPEEFISILHLGMISDGVVDTTSDEVKKWAPSFENYTLTEKGGQTEFLCEMQTNPEYKEMFSEMWPKALLKLKEVCER